MRRYRQAIALIKSPKEPLRGTLREIVNGDDIPTFAPPPTYETLSYRWTDVDLEAPCFMEIDNIPLPIGPGLYAALTQFRYEEGSRWIWVDQICINQNDPEEKFHQIAMMADIYMRAERALIWLGQASDQSDVAMEFFPIFVEMVRRNEDTNQLVSECIPRNGSLAKCLAHMFSRSWFSRLWTLVEAAFARDALVCCGQKSFSYRILEAFQDNLAQEHSRHWRNALGIISSGLPESAEPDGPVRTLNAHIYTVCGLRAGRGVCSARILDCFRNFECSEDQDRVYAGLRLLNPALRNKIVQAQCSSTSELYRCVAIYGIQQGELELLGAAGLTQQGGSAFDDRHNSNFAPLSLPSWVPDWTYKRRIRSYWVENAVELSAFREPLYTAGMQKSKGTAWSVSKGGQTLHGSAMIVGEVEQCAESFPVRPLGQDNRSQTYPILGALDYWRKLESYITSCTALAANCASHYQDTQNTCRYTLTGRLMPRGSVTKTTDFTVRASEEVVNSLFQNFYDQFCLMIKAEPLFNDLQSDRLWTDDDFMQIQEFTAKIRETVDHPQKEHLIVALPQALTGRRFFITSPPHFMGVAPDMTQPGDQICIIPGFCAPLVIRPKGDHFLLVGECYVAGLMDGEGMEMGIPETPIVFE